jgi:UDP-N-acetylglucosamine 2-epimerase (non-hydrolysing)
MQIDLIVGARPNFMKAAPVAEQLRLRQPHWQARLIHTGQHYDQKMSEVFFEQLGMPKPDANLGIGSGSHTQQVTGIMLALEAEFRAQRPDLVMVFGDVNSTLAATLVATQLRIPVAHVEAGLRSFDREMPEERNRVVTDALAELLFVTERDAEENLRNEGISGLKMHFVGNTMIDSLLTHRGAARTLAVPVALGLRHRNYVVVTLHRPSNVDSREQLGSIVYALQTLADYTDVVFPIHPRTLARLKEWGLWSDMDRLGRFRVMNPLGYLEFLGLMDGASAILTDSGGIQEEAVVLGVPCVTLRKSTERPVTLQNGANRLAGEDAHLAVRYIRDAIERGPSKPQVPELWDGRSASRIVDVLERVFSSDAASTSAGSSPAFKGFHREAHGDRGDPFFG